ncbi:DUF721 domain-containing protein [Zeaxanthinibacter sp. PT1]|nr:DUF721 domain-containing protein [Zeaxanthinibacter sp. PT1]MDC6352166.1 DUF721 domain-containing protein [Zeaxanthinibacter sp. PT1]NNF18897.1 DUF721 domain-containing protein [Flavobacteriaceae bacterium]
MKKDKDKDQSLGGILKDFIKDNKLQGGINRINAEEAWKDTMGPGVNNYTTGVVFRNDTLFVSLSSSVLREELSLGKSKIVQMLNEAIGQDLIKKIVLR